MKKQNIIGIVVIIVIAIVGYGIGSWFERPDSVVTPVASTPKTSGSTPASQTIQYTEAPQHIGQTTTVVGTPVDVYTSKTGTVFFDYCADYKSCPFSVVIFASNAHSFGAVQQYGNRSISVTGLIKSYAGHAEIVVTSPNQIQ